MWPWQLETLFGYGFAHSFDVIRWYMQTYPYYAAAIAVGLISALFLSAALAGVLAKVLIKEKDPAQHLFGNERSARRKGFIR